MSHPQKVIYTNCASQVVHFAPEWWYTLLRNHWYTLLRNGWYTIVRYSHPELKNELIPIIEDQLPYGSPAFISRGRKALKELR